MGKIKKVNRNDKYRIVLTETLPYEVPVLFSNDSFHKKLRSGKLDTFYPCFLDLIHSESESYPFTYKIVKNSNSTRKVSLPHPSIQFSFVDFYDNFQSIITSLCSRSKASLRAPHKVASHFIEKQATLRFTKVLRDDLVEHKKSPSDDDNRYASSFFQYRDFPLLFKFYDSYLFQRLERQFQVMLRFDVSKCFQSIYTHSITWAVKDKQFVKDNLPDIKSSSFEGKFDRIMQRSNSNETNGILIGPEFSRIFSEIILQRIDENSRRVLHQEGFANFKIKRYVDDYFVFAQSEEQAKAIMQVFRNELENFNLHLNESKINISHRPFITSESVAKQQTSALVNELFDRFVEIEKEDSASPYFRFIDSHQNLRNLDLVYISKYKAIAKQNGIGYEASTNIFLTGMRNRLVQLQNDILSKPLNPDSARGFSYLKSIVTLCLYCFSMDMRYRPSYLVCQILLVIISISKKLSIDKQESLKKVISDEILTTLRSPANNDSSFPHEFLNLLILHKELGDRYRFSSEVLSSFLPKRVFEESSIDLDYFSAMSFIYYLGENKSSTELKMKIENGILEKLERQARPLKHSELFLFFVDSLTCPYITKTTKTKLREQFIQKHMDGIPKSQKHAIAKEICDQFENDTWFFSWDSDKAIFYNLAKKELRSPYLNLNY
ncbi:antiviral reverse transcriptase Drt3b [Marinobacter nauticus]|uniref:antiviral reverse transcriptase Drt3b n=1 Tax=Marinobacter nauticus TaxID=2743 RepID=UPI001CFD9AF5|nr:antiviral reverse transcriptase Drt3b [Marinobacter nauticus]